MKSCLEGGCTAQKPSLFERNEQDMRALVLETRIAMLKAEVPSLPFEQGTRLVEEAFEGLRKLPAIELSDDDEMPHADSPAHSPPPATRTPANKSAPNKDAHNQACHTHMHSFFCCTH